jgi:bacteriochlorophyll 4-vinyl reductase
MTDATAKIGPNAILQLVPVLEDAAGADMAKHLLAMAGVFELPDPAAGLMDEAPAARLHQALRTEMPEVAPMLAREAGWRTADYILAHRIPKKAQTLLKLMPARLSAPILARAVAKHAWTFCGSGASASSPNGPWSSRSPTIPWYAVNIPIRRSAIGTQPCSNAFSPRSAVPTGAAPRRIAARKALPPATSRCHATSARTPAPPLHLSKNTVFAEGWRSKGARCPLGPRPVMASSDPGRQPRTRGALRNAGRTDRPGPPRPPAAHG